MWVVRESRARLHGEVVQHQEGREVLELRRADGPPDARARALGLLDGQEGLADRARGARVRPLLLGGRGVCHGGAVDVATAVLAGKDDEVVVQGRGCLEDVLLEQYYRQDSNCDGEQDREELHQGEGGLRSVYIHLGSKTSGIDQDDYSGW